MRKANFTIEGVTGSFEGFHNPEDRWNGWAKPMLTRAGVDALVKAMPPLRDDIGFRLESDWFLECVNQIPADEQEKDSVSPDRIGCELVWNVGDLGLCWLEEEIDPLDYSVNDAETDKPLDGAPSLKLIEESLAVTDTGKVAAHYVPETDTWYPGRAGNPEVDPDNCRTVYVRKEA